MRRLLALVVLPALLLAGCSDSPSPEDDPMEALLAAFEETGESDQQTLVFRLLSTPESIEALSDGAVTPEHAQTVLDSSLTISGTQADDPSEQSALISVAVPGTEGVELILLGTDLYLRADVEGLLTTFGQDPAELDELRSEAEEQGAAFVGSFLDGQPLHIEGGEQLAGQFGGQAAGGEGQEELVGRLRDALRDSSTVTSEGSDDVGDHVVAQVRIRDLYQRLLDIIPQLGLPVPTTLPPEDEVPDGEFRIDFWLSEGKLVQIEIDLLQIATLTEQEVPEGVEQLAIRLELADDAVDVSAPEGAVTVTPEEILGLIGLGDFSGGTEVPIEDETPSPAATEIDCSIYEGLPPETFEGLPQETLDALEEICPGIVPAE